MPRVVVFRRAPVGPSSGRQFRSAVFPVGNLGRQFRCQLLRSAILRCRSGRQFSVGSFSGRQFSAVSPVDRFPDRLSFRLLSVRSGVLPDELLRLAPASVAGGGDLPSMPFAARPERRRKKTGRHSAAAISRRLWHEEPPTCGSLPGVPAPRCGPAPCGVRAARSKDASASGSGAGDARAHTPSGWYGARRRAAPPGIRSDRGGIRAARECGCCGCCGWRT